LGSFVIAATTPASTQTLDANPIPIGFRLALNVEID